VRLRRALPFALAAGLFGPAAGCGQAFETAAPSATADGGGREDGPLLWLRADVGITQTAGAISAWEDQSSHHLDASQDQPGLRPTLAPAVVGGHAAVQFDGLDDHMALPPGFSDFTRGLSIVAVIAERQPRPTACTATIELSNGSEIDDISFGQYQDAFLYEVYDQSVSGDAFAYDAAAITSVVHRADGTVSLFRNGSPAGASSFALPAALTRSRNYVGRTLYTGCTAFGGAVAELLVYARALDDAELATVESDLSARWTCCRP
jgi:hypothetical protein